MKKDSEQVPYKVTVSLPYPLWLVGIPYRIVGKLGEAELSFETVRQTAYDARLRIQEGEFDFKTDRQGWASYTRVSCDITAKHSVNPLTVLLECLNQLIRHLRDTVGYYWLYELEKVDLFQVSVESERERIDTGSWGRTGYYSSLYRGDWRSRGEIKTSARVS